MIMHSRQRSRAWRTETAKSLDLWSDDFEEIVNQISREERCVTPSIYRLPGCPIYLGSPCLDKGQALAAQDGKEALSFQSTSSSSNGSVDDFHHKMPTAQTFSHHGAQKRRRTTHRTTEDQKSREYCTQTCLSGLGMWPSTRLGLS